MTIRLGGEADGVEHLVETRSRAGCTRPIVQTREQPEIPAAGQKWIEAWRCDEPGDAVGQPTLYRFLIAAEEPHAARLTPDKSQQDAKQCRLGGAVRAEQAVYVPRMRDEIDTREHVASAVAFTEVAGLERRQAGHCRPQ